MFVRITNVLISAALCVTAASGAHAQSSLRLVAVEGGLDLAQHKKGVGILRPRNTGECFAVTPQHVADPALGDAVAIGLGSRDSLVAVPVRYSEDVAVWRLVRRVDRSSCPDWPSAADVNRTLERADRRRMAAYVLPWTDQGPDKAVEVTFDQLSPTQFNVRQIREPLTEGMSGSPVQIDGMIVGILTEVVATEHYGVVLRLDYLDRHVGPFFHPTPSPRDALIYGSMLIPGMGQVRTGRVDSGLFWLGLGAGPGAYLFFQIRNEPIARTRPLPNGGEETYYETRPVNPNRRYSWIPWVVAGFGSFLEARAHAARYYIPPERSGARPPRGARVRIRPGVQSATDGGMRVQVGELRL